MEHLHQAQQSSFDSQPGNTAAKLVAGKGDVPDPSYSGGVRQKFVKMYENNTRWAAHQVCMGHRAMQQRAADPP